MSTYKRILALAVVLLLAVTALPARADGAASPVAVVSCEAGMTNGFLKGDATLTAPEGYGVALAADSADWPASVTAPVTEGDQVLSYFLKGADGSVLGPKFVQLTADLADPAVSLAAPGIGEAGAATLKSLTLQFTESVAPVEDGAVTLSDGTDTYTAPAPALTDATSGGPYAVTLPLSSFFTGAGEAASAFAPASGKTYTLTVPAGTYLDEAGRGTPALSAEIKTAAADAADCLVNFILPGSGWSIQTVGATPSDVSDGATLPSGTSISITAPVTDGEYSYSATVAGEPYAGNFDQTNFTITGDTVITAQLTLPDLPGSAAIIGTAKVGETLSGDLVSRTRTTIPGLTYTWTKNDTEIVAFGSNPDYTVQPEDAGTKLTLSIAGSGYAGARTASVNVANSEETPVVPPVPSPTPSTPPASPTPPAPVTPDAPGQPVAAAYNATSVTLNAVNGYEYSLGGSSWQTSNGFSNLTPGGQYSFYQRIAAAGQTPASPASPALTLTLPKAEAAAPNPPTAASITTGSITLNAVSGCEYAMDGGAWQSSPLFSGLAMGSTHSFAQRIAATNTANASPASAAASITVAAALSGNISVSGSLQYGKTLVASLSGGNNSGTLTFYWLRGSATVGTGATYEVTAADIGSSLTVQAVSSAQGGMISRQLGTVGKADYIGETPAAPVRESRTTTSITLVDHSGYEYSKGGSTWQDSSRFTGLSAGQGYTFYQRIKATDTTYASPASKGATIYASAASADTGSDSTDAGDGSDASSSGGTGESVISSTTTPLNTYSLTGDSTRILFSNMERLVLGNKTSEVTVKLPSGVVFSFPRGVMSLTAGTLWYDFGVTLGGCMHEAAAKSISGDAFVAIIHFNMNGNLPGKANITLPLGAANAGKDLYYYKLDAAANALTFIQAVTTDAAGNATVSQSSCSDYVFLSRAFGTAAETPVPSETPLATATPEPTVLPAAATGGSSRKGVLRWVVGLIALAALVLLFTGFRAFLRSRMDDGDDDDGNDYDGDDGTYDDDDPDESDREDQVTDLGFRKRR